MRDATDATVIAGSRYCRQAQGGHAVDKADGKKQQKACCQLRQRVGSLRDVLRRLMQAREGERIKQCRHWGNNS